VLAKVCRSKICSKKSPSRPKDAQISSKGKGERYTEVSSKTAKKKAGFQRRLGLPLTYVLVRHRKGDTNPPLLAALMTVC
jgi:hypothetical protein